MSLKLIYLTVSIILLLPACKKKEDNSDNKIIPTTTGSTNSTTLLGGQLFTLAKQYNNGSSFGLEDSISYAYFFGTNSNGNYVNAGNISYNGIFFQNQLNEYQDTTYIVNIHQPNSVWYVGGSSMVTSFSHTFTPSFPAFTGNSLLPDSFSLSTGFNINFGNSISNITDTILLTITDDAIIKKIAPNQTLCNITPADLIFVSANNGGNIKLQLINKRTVVYNNKEYYLFNNLWHTKYNVKIKP